MRNLSLTVCGLACLGLLVARPAQAQMFYVCGVDLVANTTTCSDPVMPNPAALRKVKVDLNTAANWVTLVVRARVCNPTGYAVHLADSPSNNGWAGDGGHTRHDAEAHTVNLPEMPNRSVVVFRSDIGGSGLRYEAWYPTVGCYTQEWRALNDRCGFDPNVADAVGPVWLWDPALFDFPPYDEFDAEDPGNLYADKFYVGLNGVYHDPANARPGTGVLRACFVLSTAPNPPPALVGMLCGF